MLFLCDKDYMLRAWENSTGSIHFTTCITAISCATKSSFFIPLITAALLLSHSNKLYIYKNQDNMGRTGGVRCNAPPLTTARVMGSIPEPPITC